MIATYLYIIEMFSKKSPFSHHQVGDGDDPPPPTWSVFDAY